MKKRVLSGIQPTNVPHIGNYLGAVRNWGELQNDFEAYFFVADLHALTVSIKADILSEQIYKSFALLISMGVDTDNSTLFVQSHAPAHTELCFILSCYTQFGELSRMTQFKDKSENQPENINAGLFTYPVLQAADILIYNPHFVPVGADQKQHIELCRNIALRFNNKQKKVFNLPEPLIIKETAKIMSLSDPLKKMSKSDSNKNSTVFVTDNKDVIIKKFRRAVTDSENIIQYRENDDTKAGVNNLLAIYAASTSKTISEAEKEFSGVGYGVFKTAVGEAVDSLLAPCREKFDTLISDKSGLLSIMKKGAEKASVTASLTLNEVKKSIGLI